MARATTHVVVTVALVHASTTPTLVVTAIALVHTTARVIKIAASTTTEV